MNPPQQLETGGTHGGELIATKNHIQTKCVPINILEHIQNEFGELRFAAKIIIFHNFELLCVTVYLWCSEGLSNRNNNILYQILMLQR